MKSASDRSKSKKEKSVEIEEHTGIVIAGNPRKFPAIWYRTSAAEIVKAFS